ncbi:MAG TPA: LysE family transporter [Hyphomicrobiaceae bacterium]|nr:LysE family transporter [Hyphomicrobiaceae bacterium]
MTYIPNPLIIPIGMLVGVLLALPIGPTNVLALQRAAERGFFGGLAAGIGIMLGDGLIALGATMGVHAISGAIRDYRTPIQIIGGLALVFAGAKLFFTRPVVVSNAEAERATLKDYAWDIPQMFLLTITNPGAVIGLIAIFGGVSSFVEIEGYLDALTMVAAVMGGSFCYWVVVSRAISSIRHKLDETRMRKLNQISGLLLIGFGTMLIAEIFLKRF